MNLRLILCCFAACLCGQVIAEPGEKKPSALPGEETGIRRDVSYLPADRAEKMDLYVPSGPAPGSGWPVVVWIHGGGWVGGDKREKRAKSIGLTLARAGYLCASINYQLGPNSWPRNLFDCKDAVRFLRKHSAEFNLDSGRIALAGGSAGAHLALLAAFTAGNPAFEPASPSTPVSSAVRCVIDFYGASNFTTRRKSDANGVIEPNQAESNALAAFGGKRLDDEVMRTVSPVHYVGRECPPVFIAHGMNDNTVPSSQSEELAAALRAKGTPHQLFLLPNLGHSFDFESARKTTSGVDLETEVLKFLAEHLAAKP